MSSTTDSPPGNDGWWSRWRARLVFLAAGVAIALAILSLVGWLRNGGTESNRQAFDSTEVPGEYAYLDTARVASYLSQIEGGEGGAITSTKATVRSAKVLVDTGTALSGETNYQLQESSSQVVTPTEASNFLELLDKLDEEELQKPVRLEHLDARDPAGRFSRELTALDEGDFVAIHNVRVLMPVYAQPYDAVKRFGSLDVYRAGQSIRAAVGAGGQAGDRAVAAARSRAEVYAKELGPNVRIVLNLGAQAAEDGPPLERVAAGTKDQPAVALKGCPRDMPQWQQFGKTWPRIDLNPDNARVIVPVQYALLSDEGSLLSGGESTVVGKVGRVLRRPPDGVRPRATDVCYRDFEAFNRFRLAEDLLERTAFPLPDIAGKPIPFSRLGASLERDTGAIAPAAVVIPVAIYRDGRRAEASPFQFAAP